MSSGLLYGAISVISHDRNTLAFPSDTDTDTETVVSQHFTKGWWKRHPSWTTRVQRNIFVTVMVEHTVVRTAIADANNPVWNQDFTFELRGHKVRCTSDAVAN